MQGQGSAVERRSFVAGLLAGLLAYIAAGLLLALTIRVGWNAFMPELFGFPELGKMNAIGAVLLLHSVALCLSRPRRAGLLR